jgi:hypothetical protein
MLHVPGKEAGDGTRKGCVLSYLDPPPLPAPVVVTKDFGGLVTDYQARTAEYRETNREVRVHECHSACTLALSLPNVCVYPDSIFKFHLAYNAHTRISDYGVSQQMVAAYPAAVRERLGPLTRSFKIISGAELIKLGIRDCNEPRVMVASVGKTVQRPLDQESSLATTVHGWMNTLTGTPAQPAVPAPNQPVRVASRELPKSPPELIFAEFPMPPARPAELEAATDAAAEGKPADVPLPPQRPASLNIAFSQRLPFLARIKIIGGAAPILPSTTFVAFATLRH